MATKYGPTAAWTTYIAARLVAAAMNAWSVDVNLKTAALLGQGLYRFDKRHRKRAGASIAAAFPDMSPEQIDRVVRQSFEHLMKLAVEVIQTPRVICPDRWAHRVHIGRMSEAIELLGSGRPALLLTGHLGNWEVLGYTLATLGYDLDAIARPLDHQLINDWLLGIREKRGMRIITKWDATERMVSVLKRGGALGFIADQNAGDKGLFVPFFGRFASTYKSIGLLALAHDAPIICGYAHRTGTGFHYEIGTTDIIYPEDWAGRRDPLYYITARYSRALETMIRMRPEQYLWMHRRWKSRPKHEREGKPIPKALLRNVEELPWITEQDIDRLRHPPPTDPR